MRAEDDNALAFLAEFEELFSDRENDSVLGQKASYDPGCPLVNDADCILTEAEVCRFNRVMMVANGCI